MKKKIKRLAAMFLSLLLLMSLAACRQASDKEQKTMEQKTEEDSGMEEIVIDEKTESGTVTVSNVAELLKNIAPDTHIILTPGTYNFSKITEEEIEDFSSYVNKDYLLNYENVVISDVTGLTLEGAEVEGVYEIQPEPSGLARNVQQCLIDYDIPLHLSHTVTRVFGRDRVEAVEICEVDENKKPMPETARKVECDGLILSVGLIPENELAESVGVTVNKATGCPTCGENQMTDVPGVFACGNALRVFDLVDYVSASGEAAGRSAMEYLRGE